MREGETLKGVDKINHRKSLGFFLLGLWITLVLSCGKDAGLFKKDKVVAEVDGARITGRDLVRYYRSIVPASQGDSGLKSSASMVLKRSLLERLIEEKLLLLEAAKKGITVSDGEVDKLYAGVAKDYGKDFEAYLKKLHLTPKEWKASLRRDLLIDKVIKKHMSTVRDVTRDEIKAYYRSHLEEFKIPMQYHIAQIVVPSRQLAGQVLQKLKEEEEFQYLAKHFSIFPEGKRGGDLGFWREDRLPEEFEVVRQMRVGEVSRILHSPYGYHLIKLIGLKEARALSLREAGPHIARKLRRKKREEEKARWLEELKAKAHIVRNLKALEEVKLN